MKGRFSGWIAGSLGIVASYLISLIIRWNSLPVFVDIYYHASCMIGFKDAGGVVLRDFWEFAPIGRPHLYPPLLHIIMLGLNKLGLSPLAVTRAVTVLIYPLVLVTILWVISKLYGKRTAFFTVLIASSSYSFFLNALVAIPSFIGILILILLFYALEKRMTVAGILLMGILFYAHTGDSGIAILTLFIYGILRRQYFKPVIIIVCGGLILGLPWLFHIAVNRHYFLTVDNPYNGYFEANLLVYIFAIFGMLIALKRKGSHLFYFALLGGMVVLSKYNLFRFLCGEGLLPMLLFAGAGLDETYSRIEKSLHQRTALSNYMPLVPWLIFSIVTFLAPSIYVDGNKISFTLRGSAFTKFTEYSAKNVTGMESSVYSKKYTEEVVGLIKSNTRLDDLIYCNYNYAAGMLYVFSDRATSCGMLNEIRHPLYYDPVGAATLIVWIKNPEGIFDPQLSLAIKRLNLTKVTETDIAYLYKNPAAAFHKNVTKAFIPAEMAFLILFGWVSAIFICIWRGY